jgi:hypothetical protein
MASNCSFVARIKSLVELEQDNEDIVGRRDKVFDIILFSDCILV